MADIKKFLLLILILTLSSCRVLNPSLMFKTPADYKFTDLVDKTLEEYRIAPYDILEVKMYTNDGLKLVEMMPQNTGSSAGVEFIADKEGNVRLPTVGNIAVIGLTIKDAQQKIEKAYSEFYIKPFVLLKVVNRRALVFPGTGGTGTVVNLRNENISLLEVLALAGGISPSGKAHKVKLVRGNIANPEIQLIDLSTVEGMQKANITIQANDIVYVEPVRNISQGVLAQITPLLALLTTALFLAQLATK